MYYFCLILVALIGMTGCAATSGSPFQKVYVQTQDGAGNKIYGAECALTNERGDWLVTTPNSVSINRGEHNLQVTCHKSGFEKGAAEAVSGMKGSFFGNLLIGGPVGMAIDSSSGSAYEYPGSIDVVMGKKVIIDKDSLIAKGTLHFSDKVIIYTGYDDAIVKITHAPDDPSAVFSGKIVTFCGPDSGSQNRKYQIGDVVYFNRNDVKNIMQD